MSPEFRAGGRGFLVRCRQLAQELGVCSGGSHRPWGPRGPSEGPQVCHAPAPRLCSPLEPEVPHGHSGTPQWPGSHSQPDTHPGPWPCSRRSLGRLPALKNDFCRTPGRTPLVAMVLEGFLQNLVARSATQGLFSSRALGLGAPPGRGSGPAPRGSPASCATSFAVPPPASSLCPRLLTSSSAILHGDLGPRPGLSDLPRRESSAWPGLPGARHPRRAHWSGSFPRLWAGFPSGENWVLCTLLHFQHLYGLQGTC